MIGRRLSHYEIVSEISRGGMGVVYRAVDVRLNREVALKVLPEDLVADPDRRRRFEQEAQAASALEHPHIAVIHEIDEADGVTFIAMELVRGEQLTDLLSRRRPMPSRAVELAIEIAEGMARAHERNIVHRDLKPGNVMVTEDGHVKIIDFGLAKLIEPDHGYLGNTQTLEHGGTDPGVVLGTLSYMSPEQASGDRIDHRTDIFAFGVVLYEMLTGERPFQGRTGVDTLHAIINAPTPRLQELGPAVMPEATREIDRIVSKCLEKDPGARYQGMRDLVVDLRSARRQLESGTLPPSAAFTAGVRDPEALRSGAVAASAPGSRPSGVQAAATVAAPGAATRRAPILPMAAAVVALAAAGALFLFKPWSAPAPKDGSKPSVAVLYFENNTGNDSLDWLRTGLTDMVVTDLSQMPDVQVLSTDRLHRILDEMKRADDKVISADVVDALARQAGVDTVLLGSYIKAGDAIRINVKLQEAGTGRIVSSERVDGMGEADIFTMVDDLTRRIRERLLPLHAGGPVKALFRPAGAAPDAELDRGLKDVTTASIEAYRYYSEGIYLHERLKEREAIPLLLKAVELDPGFAMALAKLAIVHSNLNQPVESVEYARRALEHASRLTPRERLYVEAVHLSRRPETTQKAMEVYRKAITLYPDHAAARQNLAVLALNREDDDVAIPQLEELLRLGGTFPASFSGLAGAYARKGSFERGYAVYQDYLRRFPDNAAQWANLGNYLVAWGRFDEATQAFDKARALGAREFSLFPGYFSIAVHGEHWDEAAESTRRIRVAPEVFGRVVGAFSDGSLALYRGRSAEASEHYARMLREIRGPLSWILHAAAARIRLDRGDLPGALASAELARQAATGAPFQLEPLPLLAEIHARMGQSAAAQAAVADLRKMAEVSNDPWFRRWADLTEGEIALAQGERRRALESLKRADSTLPPRTAAGPPSQHVPIWYALGQAHLAGGDRSAAAESFRRIIASNVERVSYPVEYVRSFYFLARIAEEGGDTAKAREYYGRFAGYWRDGDMDRDRVKEALAKSR